MDPLTAISYYAPLCLVFLVPFAFVTEVPSDWGSFAEGFQLEVGFGWLILNGFVAFALNVSVVLLISATSPVVFILCGIMKDVTIISVSVVALRQPVAAQQIVGYAAAVVGIQAFNLVSRNPDEFEVHGLVPGAWRVVQRWWAPDQAERDMMGELCVHKDPGGLGPGAGRGGVTGESLASSSIREGAPERLE
jgi:hypothetical protein